MSKLKPAPFTLSGISAKRYHFKIFSYKTQFQLDIGLVCLGLITVSLYPKSLMVGFLNLSDFFRW